MKTCYKKQALWYPKIILWVAVISFGLSGCKKVEFSGQFVTKNERPVPHVEVTINGKTFTSLEDGTFSTKVREKRDGDYVVNGEKKGYGLYSQIFRQPFTNKKIYLTQGSIIDFSPDKDATLVDNTSLKDPFMPALLQTDTAKLFDIVPSIYDEKGNLVDFGWPADLKNIWDYLKNPPTPGQGMSLTIPANVLVDAQGNAPAQNTVLQAAISTVDFFNPDGMPGDYAVRLENNSIGYMESFGAATIEIYDKKNRDKEYNLKDGTTAAISIPVYQTLTKLMKEFPKSISLLYFNEKDGIWEEQGQAIFNPETKSYEAKLRHFSTVNMDLVFSNPGCLKFRQAVNTGEGAALLSNYTVTVINPPDPTRSIPFKEKPDRPVAEGTSCLQNSSTGAGVHPVIRIPQNHREVLIFKNGATVIDIAIATTSSATYTPSEVNSCPFANCTAAGANCNNAVYPQDCGACNNAWLPTCPTAHFRNAPPLGDLQVIAYPNAAKDLVVKFQYYEGTDVGQYMIAVCRDGTCTLDAPCINSTTIPGSCNLNAMPPGTKFQNVADVTAIHYEEQIFAKTDLCPGKVHCAVVVLFDGVGGEITRETVTVTLPL